MTKGLFIIVLIINLSLSITITLDAFYDRCQCQTKELLNQSAPRTTIYKDKLYTRSPCLTWYTVPVNETQWVIASKFANGLDKKQWLKSMRYMSHKSPDDENVRVNESVCVQW